MGEYSGGPSLHHGTASRSEGSVASPNGNEDGEIYPYTPSPALPGSGSGIHLQPSTSTLSVCEVSEGEMLADNDDEEPRPSAVGMGDIVGLFQTTSEAEVNINVDVLIERGFAAERVEDFEVSLDDEELEALLAIPMAASLLDAERRRGYAWERLFRDML